MSNTNRPTTVLAVEADLRARADFRGINEAGQVHYLFGMCMALLAQANTELDRRDREIARLEQAIDSLDEQLMGEDA
jgi:hypothetical protein